MPAEPRTHEKRRTVQAIFLESNHESAEKAQDNNGKKKVVRASQFAFFNVKSDTADGSHKKEGEGGERVAYLEIGEERRNSELREEDTEGLEEDKKTGSGG